MSERPLTSEEFKELSRRAACYDSLLAACEAALAGAEGRICDIADILSGSGHETALDALRAAIRDAKEGKHGQ